MRLRARAVALGLLSSLAASAMAAESKKPRLDLRAYPRQGPPTEEFVFVAELKGGEDGEALYCPELEWRWDKDAASVQESDCPSFSAGATAIERRFRFSRRFSEEGARTVSLSLRKDGKLLATANVSIRVTWEKKPPQLGVQTIR